MRIGGNANGGLIKVSSDPDGTLTAQRGTLAIDTTTGVQYVNRSGSTRWDVSRIPPNWGSYYFNDFDFVSFSTSNNVATGSQNGASAVAGRPGIWSMSASAVADAAVHRPVLSSAFFFGSCKARFRAQIRFVTALSDGTNNYTVRAGWGDTSTAADNVDGVYLEYSLAGNSSSNWFLCASKNSVRTKTDTGIAAVGGSVWQDLEIQVDTSGVASAWVNNVAAAATVSTNVPNAVGRECNLSFQIVKDLGATLRTFEIDWVEHAMVATTMRGL